MKFIYKIILLLITAVIVTSYYFFNKNKPMKSTIIVLNGPSASGKSSIQEAFIRKSESPWIKIGIDNFFIGVLSNYYIFGEYKPQNPNYKIMEGITSEDELKRPIFTLKVGPAGDKIIDGMNRSIKAYADAGNDIIVDYIAYNPVWLENLVKLLKNHKVIMVSVNLPLEILEQREVSRATSPRGHARSHYETVHKHNVPYNLNIDTSKATPQEIAESIFKFVK